MVDAIAATGKASDDTALQRAFAVVPVLARIETASLAIGLPGTTLLHAGPPFRTPQDICLPIRNSACLTATLLGLTDTFEEAERAILAGEIRLQPAQDFNVVTPLATVVGALTPLQVVEDAAGSEVTAFAPINDGMYFPHRVGQRSEDVFQQLRWLSVAVADRFDAALKQPMPILPLAVHGLAHGDDCHGRTNAASAALVTELEARLPFEIGDAVGDFLHASPSLFLNLWMAATKCIMLGGAGVAGSSFVTAAGGNGVEAGIQVSGLQDRWFTVPAEPPVGALPAVMQARALGAIGDSAVVEALGLGAMALQCAPAQREAFEPFLPQNYADRVDGLLAGPHPGFTELGLRLGLTARAVDALGDGPAIGLGILDREGIEGRLGGGVYAMPAAPFRDAVAALG